MAIRLHAGNGRTVPVSRIVGIFDMDTATVSEVTKNYLRRAEAEDWGVDFYMFCLYNARRNRLGEPSGFITGKTKADLVFCPDDRFDAYEVIKSVQKPLTICDAGRTPLATAESAHAVGGMPGMRQR